MYYLYILCAAVVVRRQRFFTTA